MKYTFVVPVFKDVKLTEQCLMSLRTYHRSDEIIVVDDGSPKPQQEKLRELCDYFKVKFLTSYWNLGFAANCNKGIYAATGDVIILVNNDITFTCSITEEIQDVMDFDDKIGIVGFLLYYPNGRVQHGGCIRMPRFFGFAHRDHGQPEHRARDAFKDGYLCGVTGALIAIRKDMIDDIGALNCRYGLAYEDVEFCIRAWHTGWRVYYTSQVSAVHHEGYTRGTQPKEKKALDTWEMEEKSKLQFAKDLLTYDMELMDQRIAQANETFDIEPKKVIALNRKGAIGDCIMTTGIIEELKKRNPDSTILVSTICSYPYKVNPNVDKVFSNNNTTTKLADEYYDLDMVYEWDINKPVWKAFADKVFGEGGYNEEDIKPKLYSSEKDLDSLAEKIADRQFDLSGEYVVIHPSHSWACKTWNKDNWDKVIDTLLSLGNKVVVVGARSDIEPTPKPGLFDFKNALTLQEVRVLIEHAKSFIGIDSGCMHIALTTKTPVVGIFTSANPDYFIHRKEKSCAVIPGLECQFCRHKHPGVTSINCETNKCITTITPEMVLEGYQGVIK